MASKEEQTVKNLNVENLPIKKSPCPPPLQASEYCGPRVNLRRFPVKQPNLQYRWAPIQRPGEPQAMMREENMGRIGKKGRQLRKKLMGTGRGGSNSVSLWVVIADPPHQDHYDEVCFMS
ncbi:unnamed protein product [Nyctereutes procyonoides]|uniref:(raccoon dog) hypothetical protein n=1 Tax=Nyctereutes procyonoides TaxID=34880 RepID=A0A811YZ23_NYCPR|nr:unnamed protein product [Nyctereutes procyonoides]